MSFDKFKDYKTFIIFNPLITRVEYTTHLGSEIHLQRQTIFEHKI